MKNNQKGKKERKDKWQKQMPEIFMNLGFIK